MAEPGARRILRVASCFTFFTDAHALGSSFISQPSFPQAVLTPSVPLPAGTPVIRGWDFNNGACLDGIMAAMLTTGCQATALGQAVNEVNRMVKA
jgi:hypothetical protein